MNGPAEHPGFNPLSTKLTKRELDPGRGDRTGYPITYDARRVLEGLDEV